MNRDSLFERASTGKLSEITDQCDRRSFNSLLEDDTRNIPVLALLSVFELVELVDKNADGVLDRDEISVLARDLGYELNGQAIEHIFGQFAEKRGTDLSLNDVAFAVLSLDMAEEERFIKAGYETLAQRGGRLFDYFDVDRSGAVSLDEMVSRLETSVGTEGIFRCPVTGSPKEFILQEEFTAYLESSGVLSART